MYMTGICPGADHPQYKPNTRKGEPMQPTPQGSPAKGIMIALAIVFVLFAIVYVFINW
jgi:hypothetical protein